MRDDVIGQTLKLGFTLPHFRETLKILGYKSITTRYNVKQMRMIKMFLSNAIDAV